MPAVLCPAGQVWDQLPGSINCVSCSTCTEYGESPWCPHCFLGTDTPATLKEDISWLWAVAVLIVAVLLVIAGITFYYWRKIGRKYGDKRPVTVKAVKETRMAGRVAPNGASYV